jgi:hypothetical protein
MQYHVIDLANIQTKSLSLVEETFALWKKVYTAELESRNLKLNEDHFWSARLLAVIQKDQQIVAALLHNVYDLRSSVTTSHHYFHDVPAEQVTEFKTQDTDKIMTMEYLLVNPDFRAQKSSVRWGEVVIGLGLQIILHSPWDAMIGIARADKKVNQMASKMGCYESASLEKNKTPCKVMFMNIRDLKDHPDSTTRNWIERLWVSKRSYSPWLIEETQTNKQAA